MASSPLLPSVSDIARWLRTTLGENFPADTNGVWQAGDGREVARLGVARVGTEEVAHRARAEGVDALLLHRPWGLGLVSSTLGILACHEALDERLTTGENPWLAARLGFHLGAGLGERRGWPLVVLAHTEEAVTVGEVLARVARELPIVRIWNPRLLDQSATTIALANAMRPPLVALAASQGAALYLTGTLRPAAEPLLMQTTMAAVELGHEAIECWGLRWLAGALQTALGVEPVWLADECALGPM